MFFISKRIFYILLFCLFIFCSQEVSAAHLPEEEAGDFKECESEARHPNVKRGDHWGPARSRIHTLPPVLSLASGNDRERVSEHNRSKTTLRSEDDEKNQRGMELEAWRRRDIQKKRAEAKRLKVVRGLFGVVGGVTLMWNAWQLSEESLRSQEALGRGKEQQRLHKQEIEEINKKRKELKSLAQKQDEAISSNQEQSAKIQKELKALKRENKELREENNSYEKRESWFYGRWYKKKAVVHDGSRPETDNSPSDSRSWFYGRWYKKKAVVHDGSRPETDNSPSDSRSWFIPRISEHFFENFVSNVSFDFIRGGFSNISTLASRTSFHSSIIGTGLIIFGGLDIYRAFYPDYIDEEGEDV